MHSGESVGENKPTIQLSSSSSRSQLGDGRCSGRIGIDFRTDIPQLGLRRQGKDGNAPVRSSTAAGAHDFMPLVAMRCPLPGSTTIWESRILMGSVMATIEQLG
jgi:hypothetical protein